MQIQPIANLVNAINLNVVDGKVDMQHIADELSEVMGMLAGEKPTLTEDQKQKLEAIVRFDIDSMPYKYRDQRQMFLNGLTGYNVLTGAEIEETFDSLELEITEQDKEWATYQY